jgi:hypothetical protein
MSAVDEIRIRGWQQGSVMNGADAARLGLTPLLATDEETYFIVISQSCDVVQGDLAVEPYVEVMRATPAAEVDGGLAHGRHPRDVQFELASRTFEASCHERARLPREGLATCIPSVTHQLPMRTVRMLADWIAKRYTRPAFPDELNRRIDVRRDKVRDVLKKHGGPVDQILLHSTPDGEASPSEVYQLAIKLVMTDDDYSNVALKTKAQGAVLPLEKCLGECNGIKVVACDLVSESQITLDDLRYASPWDFDYLTHRASAAAPPAY